MKQVLLIITLLLISQFLNATEKTSSPLLFIGEDKIWGRQLWQTDNTASNTHIHTYLQFKSKVNKKTPTSVNQLRALHQVGADWYYALGSQLWFIKRLPYSFAKPKRVSGLPDNQDYTYYGFTQDKNALYVERNLKDHWLWRIEQGKAQSLDIKEGTLKGASHLGVYLQLKQPDSFNLQYWQNNTLQQLPIKAPKADEVYSESVYETPQGLIFDGTSEKRSKKNLTEKTDYIWWQPKNSSNRQLIYKSSTENFFILKIVSTEHEVYALRMDENVDLNNLVRFDFKHRRLMPIKGFSATSQSPNLLYDVGATSKGLFIYAKNNEQTHERLWFLTDKQNLSLLKQVSDHFTIRFKIWNNSCYFSIFSYGDSDPKSEFWISQGTPETTYIIKKGVKFNDN